MAAIFVIFVVLAFALLLFSSLQDDIPDELSFLRSKPTGAVVAPNTAKVVTYKGWKATQVGSAVELVKAFNGTIAVGAIMYPAPEIGVLCYDNKLDIRVNTKSPTTGTTTSEVAVGTDAAQAWGKGAGNNLFPPQPDQFLRALVEAKTGLTLNVSYRTLGVHASTLDTTGLAELVQQLPPNCKP